MLATELINSDLNISITLKKSDLLDLFRVFSEQKTELERKLQKAETTEVYYSPKEVSKMLQVDVSSLWRWEQKGYLTGVRIGGKKRYCKSGIDKIMEGSK